jgi:hypothetical protein
MKTTLSTHIDYDLNGTRPYEILRILNNAAEHLANRGLLTGETSAECVSLSHEIHTPGESFEIVFDNGGGATLQNHDGTVAIPYADMQQLARDAKAITQGEDASTWDGSDPVHHITDEEYDRHAGSGGYYALQLHPGYFHNWPDPDETGWNNVAEFIRAFNP